MRYQSPTEKTFLKLAIFCIVCFIIGVFLAYGQEKPSTPAPVPTIKTEDALRLSELETQIVSNNAQMQQLQAAYQQVMAQKNKLDADFAAAKSAALKNAGASEDKFTVENHKIVAKPAPPPPAAKPKR
jgi:hypothetical protein